MARRLGERLVAYGVAAAVVTAAVVLRWLLDPWLGDSLHLVTLYGAVAVAVWYGGYGPALLAVLAGYIACDIIFMEPRGIFSFNYFRDLIGLVLYLFSCSLIIGLSEALRAARRQATMNQRQTSFLRQQHEFQPAATAESGEVLVSDHWDGIVTGWDKLMGLRKERLDLIALLRDAAKAAHPSLAARRRQVASTLPQKPIYGDADPARLTRAFATLLETAADGDIQLSAELDNNTLVVTVKSGAGMSEDRLHGRVDLLIARSLIEQHGGGLDIRARGTEFVVRLPVTDQE